jgi:hypothetical protein
VTLPSGREVTFAGCPVKHIEDPEIEMWLGLYRWLERWKKTPVEMGLCDADSLDPRYFEAMELISAAMPKPKPPAPSPGGRR